MNDDVSKTLIQSLQQADAYPHAVSTIELIETHISWVLLAGTFAYKIKKPVNLGFVDFSTLERRHFYCREELRLNGRLAPHLYLDVVAITGSPERPRMGGDGEAIEYAVRMKRFSSDALLSRVLEKNSLEDRHIDALAAEVAEFHGRIAVADADSPFGTPERVHAPVVENFRHLEFDALDENGDDPLKWLRSWSDEQHAALTKKFADRKALGDVRECHGDMHLGNMILAGERVVIFDCIEFNESLRWIDVMSEVAFCAMDLEDRGRPDLAHRFLNGYLEHTGDYAGLAVLPYYLVYRALVRAKVSGIRLKQSGLSPEEQAELRDECRGYIKLAARYAAPRRPWLAITHGFSGSGKSAGTMALVEQCGAIRLRSDVERKRLFGYAAQERTMPGSGEGIYTADASERAYARLAELAGTALRSGFSIVVDATFLNQSRRESFQSLARDLDVPFRILDFRAANEVLEQRIVARQNTGVDASEADLDVLAQQLQSHEPLTPDELKNTIVVNSESANATDDLVKSLRGITHSGERPV